MRKPKENRRSELDEIVTQLRTLLRRDTISIIEKGKLLLRSRELLADEHGQWIPWLAENFDLSYRSAVRYATAAEYAERMGKSDTVSHLANVSATVLYRLADGDYTAEQEAEILAAAKDGRVDISRADRVCDALEPEDDEEELPSPEATREQIEAAKAAAAAKKEAEAAEIDAALDGPSPLPAPEASASPNVMVRAFDQAITTLKQLLTKQAVRFAGTAHTANDLEHVRDFIRTVADHVRENADRAHRLFKQEEA